MEQRKKIELTIPTIDLSLLKKLKGGYDLSPAYCIDTYDPHWYADTDDGRDDEQIHEDDNMDSQHEYEHGQTDDQGGEDKPANTVVGDAFMSNLLEGTNIDYQFNQKWVNEKARGEAKGTVVYEGQTLPDGSIAEHDTIILGDNATEATVYEELFHIWQGENCYNGDGFPSEATSAMELMDSVFDFIFDQLYGDGIWPDSDGEQYMPGDIQELIFEHLGPDGFDMDGFINDWNDGSYFDSWQDAYPGHPYGRGSDDDWEWNWAEAYAWWSQILGR